MKEKNLCIEISPCINRCACNENYASSYYSIVPLFLTSSLAVTLLNYPVTSQLYRINNTIVTEG